MLDEPTVGLDPVQVLEIRALIRDLARDRTVIFSSHILPEVQALCSRVIIINRGELVAEDTPEGLGRRLQGGWRCVLEVAGAPERVEEALARVPGIDLERKPDAPRPLASPGGVAPSATAPGAAASPEAAGTTSSWLVTSRETDPRRDIFFALSEAGLPILRLEPQALTLEEVFLHLVTEEGPGAAPSVTGERPDGETRGAAGLAAGAREGADVAAGARGPGAPGGGETP